MDDDTLCACGHRWDEHDPASMECQAEFDGKPCECFYFDEDE